MLYSFRATAWDYGKFEMVEWSCVIPDEELNWFPQSDCCLKRISIPSCETWDAMLPFFFFLHGKCKSSGLAIITCVMSVLNRKCLCIMYKSVQIIHCV